MAPLRSRRLFSQLVFAFAVVVLVVFGCLDRMASSVVRERIVEIQERHLAAWAKLLESQASRVLTDPDLQQTDLFCKALRQGNDVRVTLIRPDGVVVGDSIANPLQMENHGDRPEIVEALKNGSGRSTRSSATLSEDMLYMAFLVRGEGGAPIGVLRTAWAVHGANESIRRFRRGILASVILAVLAILGVSVFLARRLTRPVQLMREGALRYAQEDFSDTLPAFQTYEYEQLAEALNSMARQLELRLSALVQERNEREAILTSMREALIAIDPSDHILTINSAAVEMMEVGVAHPEGMLIQEAVRSAELMRFIDGARKGAGSDDSAGDLIQGPNGKRLQVSSTPLVDLDGQRRGSVLVMSDVTQLHRLEMVRKEFVSNVSHELRTPLASIKGFIETLRDGALDDPETAKRFIGIINKQADRLGSIIEDLLALSRIESGDGRGGIEKSECRVRELLDSVLQDHEYNAEKNHISVTIGCPETLKIAVNAHLLEQAVGNLLDNAIKYSPAGSDIEIFASSEDEGVSIVVADHGPGIESRHLPRLFERFYRVDKARSRELGGTGLGLAIVKHIVQAHGGRIEVSSKVGEGSIFTLRLPVG